LLFYSSILTQAFLHSATFAIALPINLMAFSRHWLSIFSYSLYHSSTF